MCGPEPYILIAKENAAFFWLSHSLSKFGEKSQGTKLHIMPFVLMCGFPSSGKSTRAEQLRQHITETTKRTVLIVGDETIGIDKNDVYADSRKEKEARATLKSAVQRNISTDDVLILDSSNYIKGYRYELYCVTKSAQTTQCVIHCEISKKRACEFNQGRQEGDQYTPEILEGLTLRFEPPDSRNRWDSPLFVLLPEDELPLEQISGALFQRKAPPPNMSTLSQPLSSTNFLHELNRITQSIVSLILEAQKTSVPGDNVTVPNATEKVTLLRHLTMAELQRMKRQFVAFTKTHPVETAKIANTFVQYINNSIN